MRSAGQNIFVRPNILDYADISRALRKQEGGEGSSDIVGVRCVFWQCLGVPEKWKLSPRSVAPLPGFNHDRAGRTGSRTSRLPHEICWVLPMCQVLCQILCKHNHRTFRNRATPPSIFLKRSLQLRVKSLSKVTQFMRAKTKVVLTPDSDPPPPQTSPLGINSKVDF